MLGAEKVLDYLADVAALGRGPQVSFGELPNRWEVPLNEVRGGIVSARLTRAILAAYESEHSRALTGSEGVTVAVGLVRVRPRGDGSACGEPLLVLPGLVDTLGHVVPRPGSRAFVPHERLASGGVRSRTLCVCDIDAYRAHQMALERLPEDGSWQNAVQRALDLFHAVSTIDEPLLERCGLELVEGSCVVALCDDPRLAFEAAPQLRRAARMFEVRGEASLRGPARSLLLAGGRQAGEGDAAERDGALAEGESLAPATGPDARGDVAEAEDVPAVPDDLAQFAPLPEVLPDDALLDHKLACGMVEGVPPLSERDRDVLASFARQSPGDLAVVAAPAGTNDDSLAIAAMANLLTEHALRGDEVPRMCCVAPPRTLDRLTAALDGRPTRGMAALPSRWLPRIAAGAGAAGDAGGRRVLGSLAATCLLRVADGQPACDRASVLAEHVGREDAGPSSLYAGPWYVPKATLHYLDCASSFLGTRVRETDEAAALLSDRLRRVDQLRCELVDAYAEVCRAAEHMSRRDNLVARLGMLRRDHTAARERLAYWEAVLATNPPRRPLIGRAVPTQEQLIERCRRKDEALAEGRSLVAEVCCAYREELERIESDIDRLRGMSATLSRRVRAASPEGQRCSQTIALLIAECGLDATQAEMLESVIDGHDTSFAYLNAMLDATVRPAEFWLATHVYEARWLEGMRDAGAEGAGAMAGMCPFMLAAPSVALHDARAEGSGAYDLLVVLDADQVSVEEGVALMLLARRAVVVGSAGALAPAASFGHTSGMLHAQARLQDEEGCDELERRRLAAWGTETLFSLALAARPSLQASLADVRTSCVEVADLRSALVPRERMSALGPSPAHAGEERVVSRMLPPLSHVLVPDSAWGQVGAGRANRAEAQAVARWIGSHAAEFEALGRACGPDARPVAVVAPYEEQALVLREAVLQLDPSTAGCVEVAWLGRQAVRTWPVVLLCATCGPDALDQDAGQGVRGVLSSTAALAREALVVFCGGSWAKSGNEAVLSFMRRSHRVGRLFSVAREERDGGVGLAAPAAGDLRAKPLSLTTLLRRMAERGELGTVPPTRDVNVALGRVGLIERVREESGACGWRPTAAGREVGILATMDRSGNPFCSYTAASAPVIASIVAANFEQ